MRAVAAVVSVVALAAAACGPELGAPGAWVAADEIADPALRPEVVADAYPPPAMGERLRVVSFNVHFGEDVAGLADTLATHPALAGADVVLLQEIEAHPGEGGSRAARLAAALAMNHVYAPARLEPDAGDGVTHGLAVLSRHPLADVAVMELARAEIGFNTRRRIALAVDVVVGGDPAATVRVVDVHLDLRLGVTDRLRQLRPTVVDHGDPVIVGGDLNTIPWAWAEGVVPSLPAQAITDFDAAVAIDAMMTGLGYAAPTSALGPTDELPVVDVRLDSLYPRGLDVVGAAVGDGVTVSDHLPVSIDLALR